MKINKLIIFLTCFTVLNMALVPLISLYGLSICPTLRIPGFFFGCAYAGSFITFVTALNFALIWLIVKSSQKLPEFFKRHPSFLFFLSYLFCSIIGLMILQRLFEINHITGNSRAPEILALASLLLGITQSYGLNWALSELIPEKSERGTFSKAWRHHTFRTMLPGIAGITTILHFLGVQFTLVDRVDVLPLTSAQVIAQVTQVIGFVVIWMIITYVFHFLSELEYAKRVGTHLRELGEGKFLYVSSVKGAWGLWGSLLDQLNTFSRILGERMNLLKSFSRFVSGEVAQRALSEEIVTVSGKSQELTIIMTDIRDFTRLSETLEASEVVRLLNEYFTEMLDVLATHQIIVDKFIGDGILAYVDPDAGLNEDEQNLAAVKAALQMLERLDEFQNSPKSPRLRMGIGVHRGNTIKGNIGSITKLQHTIIGDSVNRAARLESLSKELQTDLVITEGIWASLTDELKAKFQRTEGIRLKGISAPLDVWIKRV